MFLSRLRVAVRIGVIVPRILAATGAVFRARITP